LPAIKLIAGRKKFEDMTPISKEGPNIQEITGTRRGQETFRCYGAPKEFNSEIENKGPNEKKLLTE
jgi:hypothetical protein